MLVMGMAFDALYILYFLSAQAAMTQSTTTPATPPIMGPIGKDPPNDPAMEATDGM